MAPILELGEGKKVIIHDFKFLEPDLWVTISFKFSVYKIKVESSSTIGELLAVLRTKLL